MFTIISQESQQLHKKAKSQFTFLLKWPMFPVAFLTKPMTSSWFSFKTLQTEIYIIQTALKNI